VNPSADTSTLITWLMTGLLVATAVAGVAVVVCAVAVVAARLRADAPAKDSTVETAAAPSSDAMTASGNPAGSIAVDTTADQAQRPHLPMGAEAALNAIVELRSDPRNVVVTHRDPTGEVRLYPLGPAKDADNRLERSA
jgi:hypothetical protein